MQWGRKSESEPGWAVICAAGDELAFVHGVNDGTGRPKLVQYAVRACAPEHDGLARASRDLGLSRFHCATLLGPNEYRMLVVDALSVPRDEWKAAMRWRVKDLLDYSVDEAAIDVLDIPPLSDSNTSRGHQMFAVAARNSVIAANVGRCEDAAIPLSVIDIPEIAQRNIGSLCEEPGRALGLVYFEENDGLFTITCGGELYTSRRIEIGLNDLMSGRDPAGARDRVLLELQRSLDHFERQYSAVTLSRIMLGPEPDETGLAAHLSGNLALPVTPLDLAAVIDLPPGGLDAHIAWKLFHLIGASLRPAPGLQ